MPSMVGGATGIALIVFFSIFTSQSNSLSDEIQKLKSINSVPSSIDRSQYPKQFGQLDNRPLIEKYYCSDLCPANARVVLVYGDIRSDNECMGVGGTSLTDIAFRGFIGCAPLKCSELENGSAAFNAIGTTAHCYS